MSIVVYVAGTDNHRRDDMLAASTANHLDYSFASEFAAARFGDKRLNDRAALFLDSALLRPECSLPKMAGGSAGAEGLYRFIANDKVTVPKISSPHSEQTVHRAQAAGAVLILHDTSTFGYGKHTKRQGLGEIAGGGVGFLAHVSLGVCEASRHPLGVLKHHAWARPPAPATNEATDKSSPDICVQGVTPCKCGPNGKAKKPKKAQHNHNAANAKDCESMRWIEHAIETGKMLGTVPHVHVADRESDDYKYLAELDNAGECFVTRASHNRALGDGVKLYTAMDGMVVQLCREVYLSRRAPAPGASQRAINPPRDERMAKLQISAGTLEITRTPRAPRTSPKSVRLNYVQVTEIDVPAGLAPVIWRLVTNLPVSTPEEIARVVDIYRSRWVIEEFFKALKTGCSYNSHQIESFEGLSKLLALLLPLAWKLLEVRTVARTEPEAPATVVLTAQQVAFLRILHDKQHPKSRLAAKPTVKDAIYALARLGGHFKQNGDPGWQTIGAGLQRLLQAEEDALALMAQMPTSRPTRARR